MLNVTRVDTPELGDRSYIVDDGRYAVVIDPQRDIDRIMPVVSSRKVDVTHVAETHVHNDYVTGGLALAELVGARYVINEEDPVAFERMGVTNGTEFEVGSLSVRAVATPGHTPTHLSYLVDDGEMQAIFSGGSLLYGATGRCDLFGADRARELTRAQYVSVSSLLNDLPLSTVVYPTHGFGSFCAATDATIKEYSTIMEERVENVVARSSDVEKFVSETVEQLTAYPRYYAYMGELNLLGPKVPDLAFPRIVEDRDLLDRLRRGDWIIDLRSRRLFAKEHIAGTYGMELGKDFATYLGWVLPRGVSITLLADSEQEVEKAQRDLFRIGIDRIDGCVVGVGELASRLGVSASYRVANFSELKSSMIGDSATVLDVRQDHEWRNGHIQNALHLPFQDMCSRVVELPVDSEIWLYCRTGHRASIAASIVKRAGREPVLLDDLWEQAEQWHSIEYC